MHTSSSSHSNAPTTRRLNGRLLGFLFLGAVLFGGGLHGLHSWQIHRNAEGVLARAETAAQQGELARAVRLYHQYLKYRPESIEAQVQLAMLLDQPTASGRTLLQAFMLYESVLRNEPSRQDVRRRVVDVLMRIRRFHDALGHLKPLLESHPDDAELIYRKGQCEEGNGRYPQAGASYLLAIQRDRQNIDYHAALIQLVLHHGPALEVSELDPIRREEPSVSQVVEALSQRLVAQGVPRSRALLVRSQQRLRQGKLDQAAADIEEALELAGDDEEIVFAAAEVALAQAEAAALEGRRQKWQEHVKTAEKLALHGLKQDPPVLKLELIVARIALERGDVDRSMEALEEGLSYFPDIYGDASDERKQELAQIERQLLFGLADLRIRFPDDSEEKPTVGSLLDRMRKLGTPPEYLNFLLAEQAVLKSKWAEAVAKLEELTSSLRADRELSRRIGLMLSRCYQAVGNPDARLAVLNRTIASHPLWTVGRLEYARALADARRIEDAAKEYGLLLGVEGVANELLRLRMLQELTLPASRRDWKRVEDVLDMAAREGVDPIHLTTLRAEVRVQQKQYEQSAELLKSALEQDPSHVPARAAMALLALRREDWKREQRMNACREALKQAEAEIGPQVEWEMIRAELALLQSERQAQKTLESLRQQAQNYPSDSQRRLLERIAQTYRQRGNSRRSQEVWQELARRHPDVLSYWQALARPISAKGDLEKLQPILAHIRRIEGGNGLHSRFFLAVAQLARVADGKGSSRDLDQATQILAELARQRPHWSDVVKTQGRAAELAGDLDQAVRFFREALRLGDTSPEVVLRILQNLTRRGEQEEAMQLASRLAAEGNQIFTGEAGRFARALALQQQDFRGAVRFAQDVWEDSQEFWDQLWLAELRFQSGERGERVDGLYYEAVRLAPEEPATWFGLIHHLQRTNQFAEARAMIEEARKNLPSAQVAPTLAQCYEMLGHQAEAAKWYHEAVQAAPGDVSRLKAAALFHDRIGNHEQAEQYLNQIASQPTDAGAADMAWTRRNQALLLAAEGGYDRSVKAVELLERNQRGPGAKNVEDLVAKATILSSRPIRSDRLKAIQVFQEIRNRRGHLTTDEQVQLARLYDATGQWPKAKPIYEAVATSNFVQPEHLAEFAVALIRHDETVDAAPWVRTLQRMAPDTFVTAKTQTRFTHSMGNASLAAATIKDWLKSYHPNELESGVRELAEHPRFERVLPDWLASPPTDLGKETRHILNEAQEMLEQSLPEDARALVQKHVLQHDLNRSRYSEQLGSSAGLLEELGILKDAEELYRQYADFTGHPHATFVLAKFLSRQGRIEEALEVCAQVRDEAEPDMLAAASVSVLGRSGVVGSAEVSPEQLGRVESWVEDALASSPESPTCLVALADLRLLQHRLSDAEELYLKVLPANDRHTVALNNVAWLAAFLHDRPPEALRWINRAIEVAGPRADLLDTRAVIHILARRAEEAIRDLEQALEESPYAIGHLHLAEAKALKGEFDEATKHLNQAYQMNLSQDRLHPLEKQLYDKLISQLPEGFEKTNEDLSRVSSSSE